MSLVLICRWMEDGQPGKGRSKSTMNQMIFIRADASVNIGTGHIMRCLTLADELRPHGVAISFLCREEPGNLIHFIETKGYRVYCLPARIDRESERSLVQNILREQPVFPDWLVVDHYGLDRSYESPLRKFVKHIMVIDDRANRSHDCDLLLDQNYRLNYARYQGLIPDDSVQLLGPEYVLLRSQFREARELLHRGNDGVKRLLVSMGGSDPNNETSKVLRAIQKLKTPDIATDVVIGASNPHRDDIEVLVSQIPQATCHFQVKNMAALMAAADIGIGAGGTTTWERCCLGLPSIVITLSEDQRDIATSLDKNGVVINLGWYETVTENMIKEAIEALIRDTNRRERLCVRGKNLIDGRGITRVVEKMMFLTSR